MYLFTKLKNIYLYFVLAISTCLLSSSSWAVTVDITPDCRALQAQQTQQFHATVTSANDNTVIWLVEGVRGGAPSVGTITSSGLYTAPANMDDAINVTVSAISTQDNTEIANVKVCNALYSRAGTVYFVATTGSDNNQGTQSAPWRTIQHAVNQVQAGDTIAVRSGIYNETITINKSGSSANGFITLTNYANENPIIDGTGLITQQYGMRGLISLNNASYIRIKGFEIRNYKSNTDFIAIGVLVQGTGEYIEVRNNKIHAIEANNLPVNGNANALGIAVYGQEQLPLKNIIIDGNEVFNLKTGTSESLTIGGNVDGWQVTNNIVHNNNFIGIDAAGYYGNNLAEYNRARNGWIAQNTVRNLSTVGNQALTFIAAAIGIYVDGGHNITVERNLVDTTDGGIWLLSENQGKLTEQITVRNNLLLFNRNAGIYTGGYAMNSGGASDITVTNNSLFQNNSREIAGINSGEIQIGYHVSNINFTNNILFAGAKGYVITSFIPSVPGSVNLANNLYYTVAGSGLTRWFWNSTNYFNDGSSSNNYNTFKNISGDTDSIISNPTFTTQSPPDLRPTTGSPAINSGKFTPVTGFPATGLKDYANNSRVLDTHIDIGAYEYTH